jgi:hypothetical protein
MSEFTFKVYLKEFHLLVIQNYYYFNFKTQTVEEKKIWCSAILESMLKAYGDLPDNVKDRMIQADMKNDCKNESVQNRTSNYSNK